MRYLYNGLANLKIPNVNAYCHMPDQTTFVYVCICKCMCECMYGMVVCMYVCMYVWH